MTNLTKAAGWFLPAAVLALIWNLMGLGAFFGQITMSPEAIAALKPAEQDMYNNTPMWVNIAFGAAVIGGTLGCVGLLLKKKWALSLFIISAIGVIAQMTYNMFLGGAMDVYGPGAMAMPVMILLIAIALIWLTKKATAEHWIA